MLSMGESKLPKRVNGITGALMPAAAPARPDRMVGSEFQTVTVSKRHVIFLDADCIREVPAAEEGGRPTQEIFAKRTRRNDETGEMVADEEPAWYPAGDRVAWPIDKKTQLPRELCDLVCVPVSIVISQSLVGANGQPRVSKILLMDQEIYRVDAVATFAQHEEQLSGRRPE